MPQNKVQELTPEALIQKRVETCQAEIVMILDRYKCVLDTTVTIGLRGIEPRIAVLPLKENQEKKNEKIPMPNSQKKKS